MVTGITRISLEPPVGKADISIRLRRSIIRAVRIRAVVAYWTLIEDRLVNAVSRQLGKTDSFLCVDIHHPTNLEALARMTSSGANVYLHLEKLVKSKRNPHLFPYGMPPYLLHQKMLLFDYPGADAELWVGRHNWTSRAIHGPNIEASMVVTLKKTSRLYSEANSNLETVRGFCEPMDPNQLEHYLDLQGRGGEDEVAHHMEFIGMNADTLENQTITVFGTDVNQYEPVRRVGRDLVVTVTDSSTETEHHYGASILQTRLLPGSNPAAGSHTFASGLWTLKPGGTWPVLQPESTPPQATVDSASYFVQIQLETEQEIEVFEEPDKKQPWVTTYDSPLLARMDPEIIEDLRIPIKIPAPDEFEPSVVMAFEDKRQSTSMPLVTRKRIVRRSSDNQG